MFMETPLSLPSSEPQGRFHSFSYTVCWQVPLIHLYDVNLRQSSLSSQPHSSPRHPSLDLSYVVVPSLSSPADSPHPALALDMSFFSSDTSQSWWQLQDKPYLLFCGSHVPSLALHPSHSCTSAPLLIPLLPPSPAQTPGPLGSYLLPKPSSL